MIWAPPMCTAGPFVRYKYSKDRFSFGLPQHSKTKQPKQGEPLTSLTKLWPGTFPYTGTDPPPLSTRLAAPLPRPPALSPLSLHDWLLTRTKRRVSAESAVNLWPKSGHWYQHYVQGVRACVRVTKSSALHPDNRHLPVCITTDQKERNKKEQTKQDSTQV